MDKDKEYFTEKPLKAQGTSRYQLVKPINGDVFLQREILWSNGARTWETLETVVQKAEPKE